MWSTIDLPGFFTTEGDPAATCPSLSHCGVPGCVGVPAPDGCVGYTCHVRTPSQTFPAYVPLGGGAGGALLVPDGSGVQLPSCTIATKNPGISRIPGSAGGGWGIRTPEGLHPTRFPSVRHRPLGESSGIGLACGCTNVPQPSEVSPLLRTLQTVALDPPR